FEHPFSIEFWLRATQPFQNLLTLTKPDSTFVRILTNAFGQQQLFLKGDEVVRNRVIATKSLASDGLWHHVTFSLDSVGKLRFFFDSQLSLTANVDRKLFNGITGMELGAMHQRERFEVDELRLVGRAYTIPGDFQNTIAFAARDTMRNAFGLFHFDDYGRVTRSSVAAHIPQIGGAQSFPLLCSLDSNASVTESSSPV